MVLDNPVSSTGQALNTHRPASLPFTVLIVTGLMSARQSIQVLSRIFRRWESRQGSGSYFSCGVDQLSVVDPG